MILHQKPVGWGDGRKQQVIESQHTELHHPTFYPGFWGEGYPPRIQGLGGKYLGGVVPPRIPSFCRNFRTQHFHKTGPQSTPRAYTYSKYRLRHAESDGEDPEAWGPLFVLVMPLRNSIKNP